MFPGSCLPRWELQETMAAGVGFQGAAWKAWEGVGLAQESLASRHHLMDACSQGPNQRPAVVNVSTTTLGQWFPLTLSLTDGLTLWSHPCSVSLCHLSPQPIHHVAATFHTLCSLPSSCPTPDTPSTLPCPALSPRDWYLGCITYTPLPCPLASY